ncbi:MAG: amino acid ABC transporter permease [Clostridium sp.]|nr:MAG: amino acid ABC transporter permease [Clostridium sp.]
MRGTPSVLQLMIMYYIIFKTSNIDSVIVGIIAFGINSSAYVAEILRSGFDSIDDGQVEAGLSLGLNFRQVLRYIIIPQAVKVSLPSMGNEFVTLIKETAIAGYIGIEDLTKASDIIASRTYDYFFPLVLVALIYLLLTSVISKLLKKMERKLNVND